MSDDQTDRSMGTAVSPSKKPCLASTSSPDLRTLIEDRNNTDGFVAAKPVI